MFKRKHLWTFFKYTERAQDELEITGVAEEPRRRGAGDALGEVASVVVALSAAPAASAASALSRAARRAAAALAPTQTDTRLNLLEYVSRPLYAR